MDAPIDVDSLCLADTVRARHGLQIVLGVPVAVKDDDRVCRRQVDTETARARRQQERKVRRPGGIEVLHGLFERQSDLPGQPRQPCRFARSGSPCNPQALNRYVVLNPSRTQGVSDISQAPRCSAVSQGENRLVTRLVASGGGCGAIQALVLVAAQSHVVAHDVQHAHHLAEDQHPARSNKACFITYINAQQSTLSGGSAAVWLDRDHFRFREH